MSYILDALRRADAERERDPARGIHAHPVPQAADEGGSLQPRTLGAVAGACVVLLTAIYGWMWPREQAAPAPVPAPVPVTSTAPAQKIAAQPVIEPPPPPAAQKELVAAPVTQAAPASAQPHAAASQIAVAAKPAAAASEAILTVAQLPPEIQQGLPKLPIAGGVYSANASQRMLLVSGQLVTEGTEVAPGLVLEQIRQKSAVLRFRGWRYSVDF